MDELNIASNVQLIHNGQRHVIGDVIDADDHIPDNPADAWLRAGWVEVVKDKPPGQAVPAKATSKAAPRKRSG
jgi:hypothetical protein